MRQAAALFSEATAHARSGDVESASSNFLAAAAAVEQDPEAVVDIAAKLISIDYDSEAIKILMAAAERWAEVRPVWITIARAYRKLWKLKSAIAAYERAFELSAARAGELRAFGDLLFLARRPGEANDALQRAKALGTNDSYTLYLLARCESIAGNHEQERELLRQAIAQTPDFGSAWEMLLDTTDTSELEGFSAECVALAEKTSTSAHNAAVLRSTAGRALDRSGDVSDAFQQYEQANALQQSAAKAKGLSYDEHQVGSFVDAVREGQWMPKSAADSNGADRQPVFIIGMVRSGTSLLEQILGGLDGVSIGGESDAIDVIASQYQWRLDRDRTRPVPQLESTDWNQFAAEYWSLQTVAECRVTDKAPLNFRHVGMISAIFPEAPFIYIERDPRDVALSIFARHFSDRHDYATDLSHIAHLISVSQRLMQYWMEQLPDRITRVAYESLVADPEGEGRRLAEYCGLPWDPEVLAFHRQGSASYTFSEAQLREPLNAKGVGRWVDYEAQLQPFLAACTKYKVRLPAHSENGPAPG